MDDELFSREEIQSGALSRVRRARALLYLIEQEANRVTDKRSALMAMSPEMGFVVSALAAGDSETMRNALPGEGDTAYIQSFRNARRTSAPARLRTIESTTRSWSMLVPDDSAMRAELLHQFSLRHDMPRNRCKAIVRALGADTPEFAATYQSTTGADIASAFSPNASVFGFLRRSASTKN
ncbi:unannotated protein [freshwater metagenome]|uniref:Unannotated protein n=1 Tax=freshwater metagenome TaxID=449393 RepID=A0A6J7CEK3_9ZZZZ|nr:hypothetical protein [Actinomycetota bacterium]